MPNRIINERINTSESLANCSWFEQVLFFHLLVTVDDFGRFDARPQILRGRMFPLCSVTDKQIADALKKLSSEEMVSLYTVDGKPYLQITAWSKYQTPRAKESKYPPIDAGITQMQADENICAQMQADSPVFVSENDIRYSIHENEKSALDWAMKDFEKHRKALKRPMTDKARELILADLEKLAPGDDEQKVAILNQSIKKGWQGVFPLEGGTNGRDNPKVRKYDLACTELG